MDWRSLIGLVLALCAIMLGYRMDGGDVASLLQPTGLLVVLAGTLGAVWLQCGPADCWQALRLLKSGFARHHDTQAELQRLLRMWGATVRRSGALALDRPVQDLERKNLDPFAARGLRLLADGASAAQISTILSSDTDRFEHRRRQLIRVWESAGGTAPTMGILGAVLGLVQVMQNLAEPARLGPGIAVAFVSTLYGVGVANLLFLPIAARLKSQLSARLRDRDQLTESLAAIAAGEPAHLMEERFTLMQDSHAQTH